MRASTAVPLVRRRVLVGFASLAVLALTAAPSVASANGPAHDAKKRASIRLHGAWSDPAGACVKHITGFDPSTGVVTCTGTSVFTGTWVGSSTWTFTGRRDPASGVVTGRTREVFKGRARGGRHGTLTFVEQVMIDAAGKEDNHAHIVRGTGGLAGSRGRVRFVGQSSPDGSANGTYSGRWRPGRSGDGGN